MSHWWALKRSRVRENNNVSTESTKYWYSILSHYWKCSLPMRTGAKCGCPHHFISNNIQPQWLLDFENFKSLLYKLAYWMNEKCLPAWVNGSESSVGSRGERWTCCHCRWCELCTEVCAAVHGSLPAPAAEGSAQQSPACHVDKGTSVRARSAPSTPPSLPTFTLLHSNSSLWKPYSCTVIQTTTKILPSTHNYTLQDHNSTTKLFTSL